MTPETPPPQPGKVPQPQAADSTAQAISWGDWISVDPDVLKDLADFEFAEGKEPPKGEHLPGKPPSASDEAAAIAAAQRKANAEISLERRRLKNLDLSSDIAARKVYAERLFRAIACWIAGIFVLLLLQGFFDGHQNTIDFRIGEWCWFRGRPQFHLSDAVLLAVIGGTTVNIVGLFYVVTNYLFPTKKGSN